MPAITSSPAISSTTAVRIRSRVDFLLERHAPPNCRCIVTNFPFKLAAPFVRHALELVPLVVMLLRLQLLEVRLQFLEGSTRCDVLDAGHLARVYPFRRRLPMLQTRLAPVPDPHVPFTVGAFTLVLSKAFRPCQHDLKTPAGINAGDASTPRIVMARTPGQPARAVPRRISGRSAFLHVGAVGQTRRIRAAADRERCAVGDRQEIGGNQQEPGGFNCYLAVRSTRNGLSKR